MDFDGIKVRVCSIDDLITMKQQAGRHKDLADIEQLTKIKKNMKKTDQVNEPQADWPVTFEQVEDVQLRDMLKATPAQRLVMAEQLAKFIRLAHKAKHVV